MHKHIASSFGERSQSSEDVTAFAVVEHVSIPEQRSTRAGAVSRDSDLHC